MPRTGGRLEIYIENEGTYWQCGVSKSFPLDTIEQVGEARRYLNDTLWAIQKELKEGEQVAECVAKYGNFRPISPDDYHGQPDPPGLDFPCKPPNCS